jgi:hypothetical protein
VSDLVASPSPSPDMRASDADRDKVLQLLATATADGRLTVEEHSDLMSKALNSRTRGELDVITQDLSPDTGGHAAHVVAPSSGPSRRGLLSIFGARSKKGIWHVPNEFRATAVFGAIELDFRDAQFDASEVVVVANTVFGAVEITVPDWVRVEEEGHVIFGAWEVQGAPSTAATGTPPAPATVIVRLRGLTVFGAVEVKYKAPKLKASKAPNLSGSTEAQGG